MFKNSVALIAVQRRLKVYKRKSHIQHHSTVQSEKQHYNRCNSAMLNATGSRYHKSSERPVVWIQQQAGHRANLCSAIPTIGTVNQDADPLLRNSLHTHATRKRQKES